MHLPEALDGVGAVGYVIGIEMKLANVVKLEVDITENKYLFV